MQALLHQPWTHLFSPLDPLIAILLIVVSVRFCKIRSVTEFHSFDVAHTLPLRGLLALAVIANHMQGFFPHPYLEALTCLGTSAVAIFFFLSGYGLMKSYNRKGQAYLQGFLPNRLRKIWPLCLALTVVNVLLRVFVHHDTIAYIFWGFREQRWLNFAWFIYAITYLYVAFYVVARYTKTSRGFFGGLLGAIFIYIVATWIFEFPTFWNKTIISAFSGFIVAYYEAQIQQWIVRHKCATIVGLVVARLGISYGISCNFCPDFPIFHALWALVFNSYNWLVFLILLAVYTLGMTSNRIVQFLGTISLEIYLFHGLYTPIVKGLHVSNFWVGSLLVYSFSIGSAVLLWKWQHRNQHRAASTTSPCTPPPTPDV
jgi:peptidoglycan/LPS O-acetylase OafA/YrhL